MKDYNLALFALFCLGAVIANGEEIKCFKLLIFETNPTHVRGAAKSAAESLAYNAYRAGIDATIFGIGSQFNGFGSKYVAATPMLKALQPDTVVVITDARDVLINYDAENKLGSLEQHLIQTFDSLVQNNKGSVVVSAESGCCVGALTYIEPGDLFDASGKRSARACHSGKPGCTWNGDEKRYPWEGFMKSLAELRTGRSMVKDAYLNAGLMAGKAADLLKLFDMMDIEDDEDDQAVLTDLLHYAPHIIQLDYDQELFGNNRHEDGIDEGCVFELHETKNTLVHTETRSTPLFVHSPGKFWECHDKLARSLKQEPVKHDWRRLNNYGPGTSRPTPAPTDKKNSASVSSHASAIALGFAALVVIKTY